MFPQTAFYSQSSPQGRHGLSDHLHNKSKRMNSSHHGKFLRLNSLEGTCQTYPQQAEDIKMATASVDTKMPPSKKESKWFGHYGQTDDQPLFHQHWPPTTLHHHHPQYWPNPTPTPNYDYQVPYNLTKGQFEVWPMHAATASSPTMGGQVAYVPGDAQDQGFSKCVFSSILEWSSALANAVTTTFFPTNSSSLNPNAKVFTPLNPNAKEFQPKKAAAASVAATIVPEKKSPEVQLKNVALRKCTPFISNGVSPVEVKPLEVDSAIVESDDEIDDSDDEDDIDDEDQDQDHHSEQRKRQYSTCSLDDFIVFEDQDGPKLNREKCSPFLIAFISGSDDEDVGQENDDNWDDNDNDTIDLDDIDLAQLGLAPRWNVSTLPGSNCCSVDVTDSRIADRYPGSDLDRKIIEKKVAEANARLQLEDQEDVLKTNDNGCKATVVVTFSDPLVTHVHVEDPEIADQLRNARMPSSEMLRGMRTEEI